MDNTPVYEIGDGGSIPSGRTKLWRIDALGVNWPWKPVHLEIGDGSIPLSSSTK